MSDTVKQQVTALFNQYLAAFHGYDLAGVSTCYHLPCTLNTPDKIVLLTSQGEFNREFSEIFAQLKQANTSTIVANKASFTQLNEQLLLACIDWSFVDENQQVFADFSAFYHITVTETVSNDATKQELKIINVVSHELTNAISLTHSFSVDDTRKYSASMTFKRELK